MTKRLHQSNTAFRLMAIRFRLRDRKLPPAKVLGEVPIRSGMRVLDFGCGTGSFSVAAAQLVGPVGRVFAVDQHPMAIRYVQRAVNRSDLENVEIIQGSDLSTFEPGSLDTVLLYDLLHDLDAPKVVLTDIHRALRPGGWLSVSDHHMKEEEISGAIAEAAPFRLAHSGRWTHQFERTE